MATLILKDIPEQTYGRLQARAQRHGRSLEAEALAILGEDTDIFDVPKMDWSKFPSVTLGGNPDLSPEGIQAMIDAGQE